MTKMLHSTIICCLGLVTGACTDQTSYKTASLIINESSHSIIIRGYKIGVSKIAKEQAILAGQTKEVYIDQNDGKGRRLVYTSEIAGLDSLVVEFDAARKTVHYGLLVSGNNPNALTFSDNRNVYNENNWVLKKIKDTRRRLESEFVFTFTEQDFLDSM